MNNNIPLYSFIHSFRRVQIKEATLFLYNRGEDRVRGSSGGGWVTAVAFGMAALLLLGAGLSLPSPVPGSGSD